MSVTKRRERFPYPAFKESEALKPRTGSPDFHFASLYQDEKAWTLKDNGLMPGHSLYKNPRFPEGAMDPRVIHTAAPDVFYETDTGPKAGIARTMEDRSSATQRRNSKDRFPQFNEDDAVIGPGSYFTEPTLTASPACAEAMLLSKVDKKTINWTRRPNVTCSFAGSRATGMLGGHERGPMSDGKKELMDVVLQYSRKQKHLMQRRTQPKKLDSGPLPPFVPDSVASSRQWTQRTTALAGLSITQKGTSFTKSLRFNASSETHSVGPGRYDAPAGFTTKLVYAPNPSDAFRSKSS